MRRGLVRPSFLENVGQAAFGEGAAGLIFELDGLFPLVEIVIVALGDDPDLSNHSFLEAELVRDLLGAARTPGAG